MVVRRESVTHLQRRLLGNIGGGCDGDHVRQDGSQERGNVAGVEQDVVLCNSQEWFSIVCRRSEKKNLLRYVQYVLSKPEAEIGPPFSSVARARPNAAGSTIIEKWSATWRGPQTLTD